MAIAMCHTLPRDSVLRLAWFLAISAFIIGLVAVSHAKHDSVAFLDFRRVGGSSSDRLLVGRGYDLALWTWPSGLPATSSNNDKVVCPMPTDPKVLLLVVGGVARANSTLNLITSLETSCTAYLEKSKAGFSFHVAAIGVELIVAAIQACHILPHSAKSMRLVGGFAVVQTFPMVLSVIGTAAYGAAAMMDGVTFTSSLLGIAKGDITPYGPMGAGFWMLLSTTVLLGLSWLLAVIRFCMFRSANLAVKDKVRHVELEEQSAREPAATADAATVAPSTSHRHFVDERVQLRMVNDDWHRQQTIWIQRRMEVSSVLRVIAAEEKKKEGGGAEPTAAPADATPAAAATAVAEEPTTAPKDTGATVAASSSSPPSDAATFAAAADA